MRRGGGVPVVAELSAPRGRGKGKLVPPCITSNPNKLVSPPLVGGQGTLSSSPSIPRVSGGFGTITWSCKDLQVLQLDIEGVEATLDIARSVEARKPRSRGP